MRVYLGAPNSSGAPSFYSGSSYLFGSGARAQHYQITLGMQGIAVTNRAYIPILIKLESPDVLQPSDRAVTGNLIPIN